MSQVQLYKIVFWGQSQAGVSRNTLAKQFARRFGLRSSEQVRHFFSGRMVTLKSDLSEKQARQWLETLQRLGAQARIEIVNRVELEGELPVRHAPSFLSSTLDADQLSLSPIENPTPQPVRRNPFEVREVSTFRTL